MNGTEPLQRFVAHRRPPGALMMHMNDQRTGTAATTDLGTWDRSQAARAMTAGTDHAPAPERPHDDPVPIRTRLASNLAIATAILALLASGSGIHPHAARSRALMGSPASISRSGADDIEDPYRMRTPSTHRPAIRTLGAIRFGTLSALSLATCLSGKTAAQCTGDIFADGAVNGGDLGVLLTYWGPTTDSPASARCDLDASGVVDGGDLGLLLANWGECAPTVPAWATLLEARPNPAIVTDPAIRAAIVATGLAWRVLDTATGIQMVLVPPGFFEMGCAPSNGSPCAPSENPVHGVTLTDAFYVGRYEVTQAQWQAQTGSNPSRFQGAQYPSAGNQPVEQVGWDEARDFAIAIGMRLPTEAEWEFACRAGTSTAYHGSPASPAGSDDDATLGSIAWFAGNSNGRPRSVGQKLGNGFGLHDMSGNVWEWVNDRFSSTYYETSPPLNPPGPTTGTSHVLRGGSWIADAESSGWRSSSRIAWGSGAWNVGFRVARDP